MEAERDSQFRFTLGTLLGCLLLVLAINEATWRFVLPSSRVDLGPRPAILRFDPISLASATPRLRVAGAWRVSSEDPRVGGISALAVDGGGLLALTDSGGVIRLPRPRAGDVPALVTEVPAGPATPFLKANRDIEAVTADPAGRGWWVAFEHPGETWLFDPAFGRALERLKLGALGQSSRNAGIEGLAADGRELLLFAELGGRLFRVGPAGFRVERVAGLERVSDSASLAPGRLLVIERQMTLGGFRNRLVELARTRSGYRRVSSLPIPAGPLDNFEGLAVEHMAGRTRLWLVTDDSFQKPFRTVLLALDWLPASRPAPL